MTVMDMEDRPGQRITGKVTEVTGETETGIAWHGMALLGGGRAKADAP